MTPATTPPAHVRTVTHEQLAEQVRELHDREAQAYAAVRDLDSRHSTNHLALLHELGVLATWMTATEHRLANIEKLLEVLAEQGRSRA